MRGDKMPSNKVHRTLEKLILGKDLGKVDRLMDMPSVLLGSHHRQYFHDESTPLLMWALYGFDGLKASLLHLYADKTFTSKDSRILEILLRLRKK